MYSAGPRLVSLRRGIIRSKILQNNCNIKSFMLHSIMRHYRVLGIYCFVRWISICFEIRGVSNEKKCEKSDMYSDSFPDSDFQFIHSVCSRSGRNRERFNGN